MEENTWDSPAIELNNKDGKGELCTVLGWSRLASYPSLCASFLKYATERDEL